MRVAKGDVVDLTSKMRPTARSTGRRPPGEWVVLRMGYSLLGINNHPASPEGTGLEVDKLNPAHVKAYMDTYLDNYKSAVGPLMGKRGLRFLITDSWEAGAQNWTDDMIAEFTKRRGYDPRPWLPALTGRVVESAAASDRFLWDFRQTLADMLAEYHYEQITTILKERGMGHYGESHESGRAFIGDGMEVKRTNDVPMGAMWTQRPGVNEDQPGSNADIRESASVAHIYGQNLVAAESLTAGSAALGLVAGHAQADSGQGAGDGAEPVRDPHLGAPAARRQGPRPEPRPVRSVVHAQRNLGRAGDALGQLSGPQLLPAAAGPLRRRHRVLLRRRHERHGALRRQGAADSRRLQLRLRERRRARAPALGRQTASSPPRAACAIACWRSTRTAGTCRCRCLRRSPSL